jgi:hypothetical protein
MPPDEFQSEDGVADTPGKLDVQNLLLEQQDEPDPQDATLECSSSQYTQTDHDRILDNEPTVPGDRPLELSQEASRLVVSDPGAAWCSSNLTS